MTPDTDHQILDTLREIRDGQQAILGQLSAQRSIAEAQLERSRATVEESVGLQREALRRQRTVTLIAVPGIVACIAGIMYLVVRYF